MLESALWIASAGISTPPPVPGDLVYYFPEGHAEHAYITPDFLLSSHAYQMPGPMFLCQVAAVSLSAHSISDEVYAKITLHPLSASGASPAGAAQPRTLFPDGFVYHPKVLTASDAGNGSSLTVPRRCANTILPKLDYNLSPPTQVLTFYDAHGKAWEFKHIYRGNPLRHLLTTGWNKFVQSKMLVQGDTVVFIRGPDGRLFIRIRRDCTDPANRSLSQHEVEPPGEEGCFTRKTFCRIPQQSVVAAANLAAAGRPFEVIYYPNAGWPEFVVAKKQVDESRAVKWALGMRVKMTEETAENSISSIGVTHHGSVSFAGFLQEKGRLPPSIWRLLDIDWDDEREMMRNTKKRKAMNPWQVESVAGTPFYPALKRLKVGERTGQEADLLGKQGCPASATAQREAESSTVQLLFMPQSEELRVSSGSDTPAFSSGSNSPVSDIIVPGKSFKLFGKVIRAE